MTKRAIAYIRKSTVPDVANKSLRDQRAWAQSAALAQGVELSDQDIFDEIVSGWAGNTHRPVRDQVVDALETGQVRVLLVRELDRLARRVADLSQIFDICRRNRVVIVTADRSYVPDSPETALLSAVLGGLAESEATRISERAKQTAANTRSRGGWHGSAPFGWMTAPERNEHGARTLILHPTESTIVRHMVDLRLSGLSPSGIVQQLNADGHTTRAGRRWQYRAVVGMLRHPLLAGYTSISSHCSSYTGPTRGDHRDTRQIVYDASGRPVKSHEAIVTEDEWGQLQSLMHHRPAQHLRRPPEAMLLTGLIHCLECSSRMTSWRSTTGGTYVCHGKAQGLDCPGSTISGRATDQHVLDVVAQALDNPDTRRNLNAECADLRTMTAMLTKVPTSVMGAFANRLGQEQRRLEQLGIPIATSRELTTPIGAPLSGADFLSAPEAQQRRTVHQWIRRVGIRSTQQSPLSINGRVARVGVDLDRINICLADEIAI